MNLEQASSMADLRQPLPAMTGIRKSRLAVARRVHQLAAAGGHPYLNITPEKWAKKWLKSKEFVLMEIDINAAACVHQPKHINGVEHYFQCGSDSMDPIVVDGNKRHMGRTALGYIPEVTVHDGKHRLKAQRMQGRTRIMAWVGSKVIDKLKKRGGIEINASAFKAYKKTGITPTMNKMESTYELYASTVPSTGLRNTVTKQSSGEGGSRPKAALNAKKVKVDKKEMDAIGGGGTAGGSSASGGSGSNPLRMGVMAKKKMEAQDCQACGARSSGSLEDESASDETDPSYDDVVGIKPDEQKKFNPNKPNVFAPGTGPGYTKRFGTPNGNMPGSANNIGPRVVNKGASKSEFSRTVNAMGHEVDCMCAMCMKSKKNMDASGLKVKTINMKAPPGREDQVLELKKKYGEKSPIPFQIAWDQYQKGKSN